MSSTGLAVFDTTIQRTHIWLNDLMAELGWRRRDQAYHALRATLHALRDRLSVQEVTQLGSQLPLLLAGVYYSGWSPSAALQKQHHRESFFDRIRESFRDDPQIDPEEIARAVFAVLEAHVSPGELRDIKAILSADVRDFWDRGVSAPEVQRP